MDVNQIIYQINRLKLSDLYKLIIYGCNEINIRFNDSNNFIDKMPKIVNSIKQTKHIETLNVSDITSFFTRSTRATNDAMNNVREKKVLKFLCNPPKEYLDDIEYGDKWRCVHNEFKNIVQKIAEETQIPTYDSIDIELKGGRKYNYDANLYYYNDTNLVAERHIEFKNGCSRINNLPQILSLQARFNLFKVSYDEYYYDNYIDNYIACDPFITASKPSRDEYLKNVTKTNYECTPFFSQLKNRENFFKDKKDNIVNNSITNYLTQYGNEINTTRFSEKIRESQTNKLYIMWSNGKFYLDKINNEDMNNITYHSIKNGNAIEVKTCSAIYSLLLRWRNHKGILNPAWQISVKH